MARAGGVDECDGNVAVVPVAEVLLGVEYARAGDSVKDSVAFVLEPAAWSTSSASAWIFSSWMVM